MGNLIVRRRAASISKGRARMKRADGQIRRALARAEKPATEHDVRMDYVGLSNPPKARFTCCSEGCKGATILRQPYMRFDEWEAITEEFAVKHPCPNIKNEGYRG